MKTYVLKVEPFTKFAEPKAQALKPLEEAAEVFGAWQASGIDGAGSITPEMREDIVYECFDVIQSCVNLLESIGRSCATPPARYTRTMSSEGATSRTGNWGFGPFFSNKVVAKLIHVC